MEPTRLIPIECLHQETFAPYGWVLPSVGREIGFSYPGSDFWHVHDFNPGDGGESDIVWVNYRNTSLLVLSLEAHWLTEQVVVPLGHGEIIQVVCASRNDNTGLPDLDCVHAFRIGRGRGICMRPGCWHTSFSSRGEVSCLMITRRSTTHDLVGLLKGQSRGVETTVVDLDSIGGPKLRCVQASGES